MRFSAILAAASAAIALGLPLAVQAQDASAQAAPADECEVQYATSQSMIALIASRPDPDVPLGAELCEALARDGAGLRIITASGQNGDRTYGWAMIRVFDLASQVDGLTSQTSMYLSSDTGQQAQDDMVFQALLSAWTAIASAPQPYIDSMQEELAAKRLSHSQ